MIRVVIADDHHLVRQGHPRPPGEGRGYRGGGGGGRRPGGPRAGRAPPARRPRDRHRHAPPERGGGRRPAARPRGEDPGPDPLHVYRRHASSGRPSGMARKAISSSARSPRSSSWRSARSPGATPTSAPRWPAPSSPPRRRARRTPAAGPLDRLTSREREVLQLIAEGHTNAEIAAHLTLSEKTVEKHRGHLMAKLAVHDTAALVRFAIKHGLVSLDA